jgi:hypothetical protein
MGLARCVKEEQKNEGCFGGRMKPRPVWQQQQHQTFFKTHSRLSFISETHIRELTGPSCSVIRELSGVWRPRALCAG